MYAFREMQSEKMHDGKFYLDLYVYIYIYIGITETWLLTGKRKFT